MTEPLEEQKSCQTIITNPSHFGLCNPTTPPLKGTMMKTKLILYSLTGFCSRQVVAFVVPSWASTSAASVSSLQAVPDDTTLFDRMYEGRLYNDVTTGRQAGFGVSTLNEEKMTSEETLIDRMVEEWSQQAEQLAKYERSIASDGYLTDLVVNQVTPKAPNKAFMEKEMRRHDSLLEGIQHAIESDPYLDGIVN